MKKTIHTYMAVALLAVGALTATAQTKPVSVTCNDLRQKGNTVHINATIEVDGEYVKSKKSLTLTPVLESSTQKMGLPSVLLNGKNHHKVYQRQIALGNLEDEPRYAVIRAFDAPTHTIAYETSVPWEEWMKDAQLVITEDLCGCGKEEAAQQGPWPIMRRPDQRYTPAPVFAYLQPEVETRKERAEVGTAYLEFVVGQYQILPNFRNNAAELDKIDRSILEVKENEHITVNGILLKGFASPEGKYTSNARLAENRVKSLRTYLSDKYKKDYNANIFSIESEPEDWTGFKAKVEADQQVPARNEVLAIINSNDEPDTKEAKLRALQGGKPFQYVLKEIFPSLRRTDYKIDYTVRGFDLAEAREIIKKRPDHLSLNEMFAVANSYEKGSQEYNEVFDIAVRLYENDPVANLNAANIAMSKGEMDKAKRHLEKAGNSGEAVHARGVYALLNGNYTEAETLLKQAKAAGVKDADNNLQELQKKVEDNILFDSFK